MFLFGKEEDRFKMVNEYIPKIIDRAKDKSASNINLFWKRFQLETSLISDVFAVL